MKCASLKIPFLVILILSALLTPRPSDFRTDAAMTEFTFSHSGMSSGSIYSYSAAQTDGQWQALITFLNESEAYTIPMSDEDAALLAGLLDAHSLWSWADFHRSNPRVMDGEGFRLTVQFADGQTLSASGSNSYPKNFTSAKAAIDEFFEQLLIKNNIVINR